MGNPLMACHESVPGREYACVGWLMNQFGPGNNLAVRMAAIQGSFDPSALVLDGEQHESIDAMCDSAPRDDSD